MFVAEADQKKSSQCDTEGAAVSAPMMGLESVSLAGRLAQGDTTLPQLLRYRAQTLGDALALREKDRGIWRRYSWNHYYATVRRVALGLRALGVGAGDRVAIASEDTPEWFYADLGAESLGAVVVGIYPTNPWPELQYIVRHSGARVVFAGDQEQTDKVLDALANEGGLSDVEHVICVDMKGMRHYTHEKVMSYETLLALGDSYLRDHPSAEADLDASIEIGAPDDCCFLVYTSGTTGPPKGSMISHRNIIYSAYAYSNGCEMEGVPYEAVCYLPLCHMAERCYSMVMQLVMGGRVNFAESIDTVAINVREIAPTFFIGVPRIYEKLHQGFLFKLQESGTFQRRAFDLFMKLGRPLSDRRQLPSYSPGLWDRFLSFILYWGMFRNIHRYMGLDRSRHRLCAGAAVSPELMRFFDIIGLPVSQGYGLTESGGVVFLQRSGKRRVGAAGVALQGVEWRLADDGEIQIRCPGIFKGYFRDERATVETITSDGWLLSGDIVEVLDDGEISIVDRKKAIIITSGGKNIAPSELENAIKDSPFIAEAIVVGEARKFLGALIQIDVDTVGRWAQERSLAYTTYKSLTVLPEVKALVQGVVDEVNSRFARVENIRKFVILEKELDHDDGELTATQKVRRSIINKKFAKELVEIYGE
ncbi:AMP-binding protein [Magnetospirillum sp. 15-1]|uniref:AMP-dependent synthetase/ligase n=1 Tax=Magnetospirillum sp. 15-1 TaxID=1979370 RepID=UPI0018D588E1|nr:AMP-binding protein [Magnetospirillum sp. 15-1]